MENIVLGFDGTQPSLVALDWTAARAARTPTRVEIVRVRGTGWASEDRGDAELDAAERRVRDRAASAEVVSRIEMGRMPEALLRSAERADLLVIGIHRRRPVRSTLAGWLPLRIVSRSPIATAVVPDDWSPAAEGSVVVGVDDDDSSSAAVDFAAAEAASAGAALTMLHAWTMPLPTTDGSVALLASPIQVKGGHRRILEDAHRRVIAAHPDLSVERALINDNPTAALLAASRHASLLVLGTHHRGFIAGAMLGSVGQDALWESRTPICVIPGASSSS